MTQIVTQPETLQAWWESQDFAGKEFCLLKEDGALALKQTKDFDERTIAHLSPETADAVLKALIEKYTEIKHRVSELHREWEAAEDKLKLVGKVARTREYLLHANAAGDIQSLLQEVMGYEIELQKKIDANYMAKLEMVEQMEKLAAESENWKETTQTLREATDQWKQLGYTDKERTEQLWARLEEARNKFFERKRIHQEEHQKEILENLDIKMEIVEKAEAAANSENWKATTELFRELMEKWKNTGRTTHDKNEELWNRFIAAKNNFFSRKKEHFEQIQQEQLQNYEAKLKLVEEAESLKDSTDWTKTTQAFADLIEKWKNTGRVPADKADELWKRLNDARDHFYQNKRQYNETLRISLEDNYAQKMALLKRAEQIKDSVQWRETTEEMNELMNEWKKIGPVPRQHANTLWEQFIAARKYFFERKDADRERRIRQIEKKQNFRLFQTRQFLEKIQMELKEEEEQLADFRLALENVTPGNKEEELRKHLGDLIAQSEVKVKHKTEKVMDLQKQLEQLIEKDKEKKAESNPTTEA